MNKDLDKFVNAILMLSAPVINIFGGNLPGMSGYAATGQGMGTSASQITQSLRDSVLNFSKAVKSKADVSAVKQLAKQIEGYIMTDEVLSVLSKKYAAQLIDELHDLVETYTSLAK